VAKKIQLSGILEKIKNNDGNIGRFGNQFSGRLFYAHITPSKNNSTETVLIISTLETLTKIL